MRAFAFARDERGSATISAIFFAAFLVACLGYVAGVGETIAVHEAMRDAADATALAPSIVAARAMNVLAIVNLVMAAILAVLVAVKIVQLLLLAANVFACAIPFNPICPLLTSWESPFDDFVRTTDKAVDKVNRGLYGVQSTLARSAPLLGQARGAAIARSYRPIVDRGSALGLSLVPPGAVDGLGDLGGVDGRGARPSRGARFGLPVEDERYSDLCVHASAEVGDVVFVPLKFLPGSNVVIAPVMRYAGHLLSGLVRAFPQWFCGGPAGGLASLDGLRDIVKIGTAKATQAICTEASRTPVPTGGGSGALDSLSCTAAVGGVFHGITNGSALGDGSGRTSKRVYGPASLGSDWYATWGVATKAAADDADETLVRVGSWGRAARSDELPKTQVSKSEIFFEPRDAGPKLASALADEALLHPRWTARLRITRMPTAAARRVIGDPALVGTGFLH